jgi:hypothetical protein
MKSMMITWALMLTLLAGCTAKEATVALTANVKTNQGDPVQGAVVSMDGQAIGETDLNGVFTTRVNVPVGERKRIEIKKESDAYYFAPYYENFTLADAQPQELSLNAVLYFVPKPQTTMAAQEQPAPGEPATAAEPAPAGGQTATADAAAEPAADPATIAPSEFATIKEEDISEEVPADVTTASGTDTVAATSAGNVPAESPASTIAEAPVAANDEAGEATGAGEAVPSEQEVITAQTVTVPVEPVGIAEPAAAPAAIKPANKITHVGESLFTVHTFMGKTPVKDVNIAYGLAGSNDLKDACRTNERGRCVIRFPGHESQDVTLVASRAEFKTVTRLVTFVHKGKLALQIEQGHTLDIYALEKNYNYKNGIQDAEIFINGKTVGRTDSYGKYSYLYEGKKEDLISVSIKAKGYLPEVFETDFVASDSMALVKIFAPENPPPAKVVVLSPRIAGRSDAVKTTAVDSGFDQKIRHATSQSLFATAAFKEYPQDLLEKHLKAYGAGTSEIMRKGWADLEIKKMVDVLLVPTVIFEDKTILELSMIDARGTTVAAAKETLDDIADSASINRAVADIAKKVIRAFPFEGAVLSKSSGGVAVNLGFASGRGVRAGDYLDVYGLQVEKHGKSKAFGRIGTLVVKDISDAEARCIVQSLEPRAVIERGDIVAMRIRKPTTQNSAQIRVTAPKSGAEDDIAGANVYFNDTWIGATDSDGRLYADVTGTGTLKVIKQGFAPFTRHVGMRAGIRHDVTLAAQAAYLRVDSQPQGAKVLLDGKSVGVTPLNTPVAAKVGFVKLQLDAPDGFKTWSQVLELDEGTLDLTGARSISLETDILKKGLALKTAGKWQEAAAAFAEVPATHSDYLTAQHELGQIFLTNLNMPARAAEAFGHITATENVKSFSDKSFIGSHINEGVAIFQTAERLAAEQPEAAQAHYRKAIMVLEGVVPHLRHVPAAQYPKAVHNVDYYRALARHRLWSETKDPALLSETLKTWKSYIDGSARSVPVQAGDRAFIENAQVFYRQALATYNSGRSTSKQ